LETPWIIVFDLEGTLAASKSSLNAEMASLLRDLLDVAAPGLPRP
jgi:hypothetical protein